MAVIAIVHARPARADSRDSNREVAAQKATAQDLSSLDTLKAVPEEIALLKTWLDEAVNKPDRTREILDRCLAQTELIRVQIAVSKLKAQADEHEKAARDTKDKIKKAQKALEEANIKKKALEMNAK
jgi:predicted  nucleic acid-binding Zn-ribbon protein